MLSDRTFDRSVPLPDIFGIDTDRIFELIL